MRRACDLNDIELNSRGWKVIDCFGGKTCLILKDGEEYRGFVNVCPHMGGPTIPVEVDGKKKLKCTFHGSLFDSKTGMAETPPASDGTGLRPLVLAIENETIYYS